MQNFNQADVKKLESAADVDAAREMLNAIIEKATTGEHVIKAEKANYLRRQVEGARSKADVIAIAWNMLLAGEGLASVNSKYQKRYA
jgi:hypothetical protein